MFDNDPVYAFLIFYEGTTHDRQLVSIMFRKSKIFLFSERKKNLLECKVFVYLYVRNKVTQNAFKVGFSN